MPQPPQKIFLTGATGFVGSYVLRELLRQGYHVQALVRDTAAVKIHDPHVVFFPGSILDPAALRSAVQGCQAAIHLVGIIAERQARFFDIHTQGTGNVVEACGGAGIRRYVHMSAQGTRPDAVSNYHKSKWQAEEIVRASSLAWTIFRSSLIYGPGGEFTRLLRDWSLGKAPPFFFMPYFGQGLLGQTNGQRISPVFVGDVAQAFVAALQKDNAIGQAYSLGGPESFTWPEMLALASRRFRGRTKLALGIPAWLAKTMTALHLPGLPFNRDQIIMALEDNTTDNTAIQKDFPELNLQRFGETLTTEI